MTLPGRDPVAVVRRFVDTVNRRDPDRILDLTTEDHVFVDSLGFRTSGRASLHEVWAAYFKVVPDFRIALDQVIEHGQVVVAFGAAAGTWTDGATAKPENRWTTPAAWRAVVRDQRIAEWRIYTDHEPMRAIARRNARP